MSTESLLEALRARGGAAGSTRFTLPHDGVGIDVRVTLDNDDDVSRVDLSTGYHGRAGERAAGPATAAVRPLAIALRRVTPADREARREGLVETWASGDADFDADVYVDSPTRDPHVLAAVLCPSVREAAHTLLLLHAAEVWIDDDGAVRATVEARRITLRGEDGTRRAALLLDALATLRAHLPTVAPRAGAHPPVPLAAWTRALSRVGAVGWAMNVSLLALVALAFHEITGRSIRAGGAELAALLLVGALGGALGRIAHGRAVATRARGRSDALRLRGEARVAGLMGGSVIAFLTGLAVLLAMEALAGAW